MKVGRYHHIFKQIQASLNSERQRTRLYDQPMASIESFLKGSTVDNSQTEDLASLAVDCHKLSTWLKHEYVQSAWNKIPVCTNFLWKSLGFSIIEMSLCQTLFLKQPPDKKRSVLGLSRTALLLCTAHCVQDQNFTALLTKIINWGLKNGFFHDATEWLGSYALTIQADIILDAMKMPSPYFQILQNLHNPDSKIISAGLEEACVFHIERARESTDHITYEFDDHFLQLTPVELIGAMIYRRNQSLAMPVCNHPLWQLPTTQMILQERPTYSDILIDQLYYKLGLPR